MPMLIIILNIWYFSLWQFTNKLLHAFMTTFLLFWIRWKYCFHCSNSKWKKMKTCQRKISNQMILILLNLIVIMNNKQHTITLRELQIYILKQVTIQYDKHWLLTQVAHVNIRNDDYISRKFLSTVGLL